jgi:catechol 2,3-dioxygenase-like lactoylglutathione lyase family enzyme
MHSSLQLFGTRVLCVLATLSIFPLAISAAQAPAEASAPVPTQTPELAGIAHAAIRVADLDKSRDFYEKLGFAEAFSMSRDGKPTQSFIKVNDRQFIELYPQMKPTDTVGFMHVCFESGDIEALNRTYLARGLSPTAVRKAGAGNLLFTMAGPEQQNIEYTQYMPGSKHTNDKGLHLGAHRISEQIVAMGIEMQDPAAARTFYTEKLAFAPTTTLEPSGIWLALPGPSGLRIEIIQHGPGSVFQFFFGVPDLRRAAQQLKALHTPVKKYKSMLSIQDPDGNRIIFVKAKAE